MLLLSAPKCGSVGNTLYLDLCWAELMTYLKHKKLFWTLLWMAKSEKSSLFLKNDLSALFNKNECLHTLSLLADTSKMSLTLHTLYSNIDFSKSQAYKGGKQLFHIQSHLGPLSFSSKPRNSSSRNYFINKKFILQNGSLAFLAGSYPV